jgi:hypothetical protein
VDKQSKVFSITNKDFSTQKWPDLIARKSTEDPHCNPKCGPSITQQRQPMKTPCAVSFRLAARKGKND